MTKKKKKKGKHKARGGGVRDKILKAMIAKTQTPILLCHQGICGRACNKNSLVCDGYEEENYDTNPVNKYRNNIN